MVPGMVRVRHLSVVILILFGVSGCRDWPDLPGPPGSADAQVPRITPLSGVLASANADTTALANEAAALQARAAALRAQADASGQTP